MDYPAARPMPDAPAPDDLASGGPVHDVREAFVRVRPSPGYVSAWTREFIPGSRYMYVPWNGFGRDNHLQGIVRLPHTNHAYVTGGDKKVPEGHLFLLALDSRRSDGAWGQNELLGMLPPRNDSVVALWRLGNEIWHPGGIDVDGRLLVIAMEHHEAESRIDLFDVGDPENPVRLDMPIVRDAALLPDREPRGTKAAAAGVTRLADGRRLLAVRVGETHGFDFYRTRGDDLASGFPAVPQHVPDKRVVNTAGNRVVVGGYQSISVYTQDDGRVFLFGAYNTSPAAPLQRGINRVDLFELEIGSDMPGVDGDAGVLGVTRLERGEFPYNDQHNMDAGTTVHADEHGQLQVYCAYHFCSDGRIKLCEFQSPRRGSVAPVTGLEDAWIELYDEKDLRGNCLLLRGPGDSALRDWERVRLAGRILDKQAASVRYQIPVGHRYTLYRRRGFQGANALQLPGAGSVVERGSLGSNHRRSSSSRLEAE